MTPLPPLPPAPWDAVAHHLHRARLRARRAALRRRLDALDAALGPQPAAAPTASSAVARGAMAVATLSSASSAAAASAAAAAATAAATAAAGAAAVGVATTGWLALATAVVGLERALADAVHRLGAAAEERVAGWLVLGRK